MVCRTARTKQELIRIVRTPDGQVRLDDTGRQAGRGAYVCRDGDCRMQTTHRGALAKALRIPLPAELRAALEAGATTMNEGGARGQE